MSVGELAAEAALALVGVPFRLHGRDPRTGLDCVGVAAAALGGEGRLGPVASGYALRSGDSAMVARSLLRAGLVETDEPQPGDVIAVRAGAGQVHLVVLVRGGIVHADAMLRKVVFRPGAVPWPVLGIWRIGDKEE